MPAMGPSNERAKHMAKFVADKLYDKLDKTHVSFVVSWSLEKILKNYFINFMGWKETDLTSGYNYYTHDFDRYKYLTLGYLEAKVPASKEKFEVDLQSLYFIPDAEDFWYV